MESNSFLKVGTLLNHAKYRIEQYLASGGFGNTYEGVNVSLDKKCAIKEFFLKGVVLRDEHTSQVFITHPDNKKAFNSQKEKFTKEARRLSRLDNSHIVRVFDFFEENGTAYYVMDYIEGESLRELQKRTGKALTEQETLSVLTQMLDALKSIHEAGLLHMDIKPANIMIDNKGKCTLIDFGASKQPSVSDGATTSSTMAYTPGYAPTEQIGGSSDRWGPWTDFYALGATLYNLLTKENPGDLDIEEDGEEAFKFPPEISASTRSLIQWMMSPKRKDRPQNVNAIRECLAAPVASSKVIIADPEATAIITSPNEEITHVWRNGEANSNQLTFIVDGVSFTMVYVSGGTFTMGATAEQGLDAYRDEKPVHSVTLSGYCIGQTLVTQALWETVMGNNPSYFKGAQLPVETVSWNDCQIFISRLNAKTGKQFRLPTEAEWEYAARGGHSGGSKYAGSDKIKDVAWCAANSHGSSHDVGIKNPNCLGIYDMSGNVWEWCQDLYGEYSFSFTNNPEGSTSGYHHVNRGGSWFYDARFCRVSFRNHNSPSYSSNNLGLRLAL